MKTSYNLLALPLLYLFAANASATIQLSDDLLFSAFGSTSVTQSSNETPLFINREITDETCFDCDSTLGLQLDYQFSDNFTSSIQVVKRPQDEWSDPSLEWVYIGYNYQQYDIKLGRLRLPSFLDSEYYYVAQAYSAARPPQEVYDSLLGVTSYDGLSIKWQGEVSDDISVSIEPHGTLWGERKVSKGIAKYTFDINHIAGMKIELNSYDYRVYVNALHANFDLTSDFSVLPSAIVAPNTTLRMVSLGGEYLWDSVTVRGEAYYSKDAHFNWYTQLAYHLNKLTPYISYAQKNTLTPERTSDNQSITGGLRIDFTPNLSINLEYQRVITDDYAPSPLLGGGQFTEPFVASNEIDANVVTLMVNFIL